MKVVILCVTVFLHYVLWSIINRISNYGGALWKPVDWLKEEQTCISTQHTIVCLYQIGGDC